MGYKLGMYSSLLLIAICDMPVRRGLHCHLLEIDATFVSNKEDLACMGY